MELVLQQLRYYASAAEQAPLTCLAFLCLTGFAVVHSAARNAPKGLGRVLPALPFLPAYFLLSRRFPSAMVRGAFCLGLSWVTPGKLLLCCLGRFLDDDPHWLLSHFSHFAAAHCFPIRIKAQAKPQPPHAFARLRTHLPGILVQTLSLFVSLNLVYLRHSLALPSVPGFAPGGLGLFLLQTAVYMWCIFLVFDLGHRVYTAAVHAVFAVEAHPTFDSPFLSETVTEFWGKRWNLNANSVVREFVYRPVLDWCSGSEEVRGGEKPALWARLVALFSAFLFSGFLHEIAFVCATQATTTKWEATLFFIAHGLVACWEVFARRMLPPRLLDSVPATLCWILNMAFLCSTSAFLFFPPVKAVFDAASVEYVNFQNYVLHCLFY